MHSDFTSRCLNVIIHETQATSLRRGMSLELGIVICPCRRLRRVTPSRPRRQSCKSMYKKSTFVPSSALPFGLGDSLLCFVYRLNRHYTPLPKCLTTHLEIGIILAQRRQLALGVQIRINELIGPIPLARLRLTRIRPQGRDIRIALDIAVALQIRQRLIEERLDILGATISLEIVDPDFLPVRERGGVIDCTLEFWEARCSLGSSVVPVDADHIDRAPCLAAQIQELGEPV